MSHLNGAVVVVNLVGCDIDDACRGTGDEQTVAHLEGCGLDAELSHAELRVVLRALAHIDLALGGVRAVVLVPLAHLLPLVVTVPEASVEDGGQTLVPLVLLLLSERAVDNGLDGLLVALHHRIDIFGSTGTSLNLEDTHTARHQAVDEAHGLQVLGRHDVLVVDFQLVTRLVVGDGV